MTRATGHIRANPSKTNAKTKRPAKVGRPSPSPAYTADGIGEVPRPSGTSRDAFGLVVDGDCLAPKVRNGQVIIVEKGLPRPGELAVVWAKGLDRPQVKILARELFGFPHHPESTVCHSVELEQLNPPRRFRMWADGVDKIMRVSAVVDAPR
jgi:hypothetical protein